MRLRPTHAVAAGAAVLGLSVAAPALAGIGLASDPDGQPPPGSSAQKESDFELGSQPPAGSRSEKTADFRLGEQPANRNPHRGPSKPMTVVDTTDKGKKGVPATRDRGKKNAPVTRD